MSLRRDRCCWPGSLAAVAADATTTAVPQPTGHRPTPPRGGAPTDTTAPRRRRRPIPRSPAAAATDTTAAAAAATNTTAAAPPAATRRRGPAPTATPYPTVPAAAGSLKITFWYGLTGVNGGVVQQVVNQFNTSQTKYYVEASSSPTTTTRSTS